MRIHLSPHISSTSTSPNHDNWTSLLPTEGTTVKQRIGQIFIRKFRSDNLDLEGQDNIDLASVVVVIQFQAKEICLLADLGVLVEVKTVF